MINIPNYKIIKKLGEGGMGTVYLAEHEIIGRKVAIKSLHSNLISKEEFITRFRREAKLLASLDHPNIVRLNEYFEHDGGLFLIMEYVDGIELDVHINKISGPIPEEKLITLFTKILDAIGYAHERGMVHRDIKPSNVIITKDGNVKILDFGIAKLITDNKELTKSGVQVGTVTYMSPEQVKAEKIDKLTDIYSLGVTLYQMAVGKAPYKDTSAFETQMQIINKPFPKAQDIYPRVSDKIESIINKATEKEKKDRYQSCEDFIQALNSDGISTVIINDSNEKTIIDEPKVKKENKEKIKTKRSKNTEDKKSSVWKIIVFLILFAFFGGFAYIFSNNDFKMEDTIDTIKEYFDGDKGKKKTKKKNIIKFNADKMEDHCDVLEYLVYVYTELNELAEDSDKHNAYEMNSKSRRKAESLIREYFDAYDFLEEFLEEDLEEEEWEDCKKYDEFNSWVNNDFIQDFYEDMAEDISDDYLE